MAACLRSIVTRRAGQAHCRPVQHPCMRWRIKSIGPCLTPRSAFFHRDIRLPCVRPKGKRTWMAHPQQLQFIRNVREHLATDVSDKSILEVGSYDVNGSVRKFFPCRSYVGVDLTEGPGVDLVCAGDKLALPDETFDLAISSECFEHNPQWLETFLNMVRMTKSGGVVIFTCATTGRREHGTTRTSPNASPGTQSLGWDYYRNLTQKDFERHVDFDLLFESSFFLKNSYSFDLFFVGIKRGAPPIFRFDAAQLKAECAAVAQAMRKEFEAKERFPKALLILGRATLVPVFLAAALPARLHREFAYAYYKVTDMTKAPVKYVVGKILGR